MGKRITIGRMADLSGVSRKSLRKYDRMDLLEPDEINEETGYRYYSQWQPWGIWHIKAFQAAKLTLSEIGRLFGSDNLEDAMEVLTNRIGLLERERDEIDAALQYLRSTTEMVSSYGMETTEGEFFIERLPSRTYVEVDLPDDAIPTPEEYEDLDTANRYWIQYLHELSLKIEINHLPGTGIVSFGSLFDREHLEAGLLVPSKLITFDERLAPLGIVRTAPAGLYLSVCFNDMVPLDDKHKDVVYLRRLLEMACELGFKTRGDCLDEVLFAGINHVNYTKLQIRIAHDELEE